ncbi:hypothetical protein FGO68_gene3198 [Halteria grandinella]|uniref:Uncharacterized protein n=1 Tax=Halteria grandinella TaxID=5974 RepID=A0A8J8T3B9_HALGN|nr:hypothetical protein FGO68_gene3198 [Halteria grandinella]
MFQIIPRVLQYYMESLPEPTHFLENLDPNLAGGVLFPYLSIQDIISVLSQLNRQLHRQILSDPYQSETLWKSLLLGWSSSQTSQQRPLVSIQTPLKQKQIQGFALNMQQFRKIVQCRGLMNAKWIQEAVKCQKALIINQWNKRHLEIEGVKASSQDFNQSIYRTLDRNSLDFFWSSTGSVTTEHTESLVYKISQLRGESKALIRSVIIAAFRSRFQPHSPLYPPRQIQLEIGDSPDEYFYQSPIFEVNQNSDKEQIFTISPDFIVGEYIKVNLIGKPGIQTTDNKYYHAIRYVGFMGIHASEIAQESILKSAFTQIESQVPRAAVSSDEEMKEDSQSSISDIIKTIQEIKSPIGPVSNVDRQTMLNKFLFQHRRQILDHFHQLWDYDKPQTILTTTDIIDLLIYSQEEYGNVDLPQARIIFKIIDTLKGDDNRVYAFLTQISTKQQEHFTHELQLYTVKDEVEHFLYDKDPASQVSQGTKELFLRMFFLMHELFEYTLEHHSVQDLPLASAINFLNILGFQVKQARGYYLDVPRLLKKFASKYGLQRTIPILEQSKDRFMWAQEDKDAMGAYLVEMKAQLQVEQASKKEEATGCSLV